MANIHASAIIAPGAELHDSVTVGPYSVIGAHVKVGAGTHIGSHCVIDGRTTIGRDNRIFQFASLGGAHIGNGNTIREFCTFNLGTAQAGGVTRLGDDNWMMAYTHLAHDCQVGNKTIFANNAQIAGHVEVGDWVILGAFTAVHQFVKIGAHAMTAMGTILLQDVPPFSMISGNPAQARTFNLEGLKRRGFSGERLAAVKQMHRLLYRQGHPVEEARVAIQALVGTMPEAANDIAMMAAFLARADRGIVR
jgi:UDP-N-acetylglucosamine acyltransferase